jgi:hypothetical protein
VEFMLYLIEQYRIPMRRPIAFGVLLSFLTPLPPALPSRAVCRYVSHTNGESQLSSLSLVLFPSLSLAQTLTHAPVSPSRNQSHSLGCNQTMLRGGHRSRGGKLPHRPSKTSRPSLPIDSTCGWFNVLPREIRDEIYDLISQPKEETHDNYHFKTLKLVSKARLVNKQFTKEYDERPPLNSHLEVTQCHQHDWNCWHRRQLQGPIPTLPAQTKFLHFNLIACADPPWRRLSEMRRHQCLENYPTGEIEEDLQESYGHLIHGLISVLPVLEKVSVNVSCGNLSCAVALQSALDLWRYIPHLSRITLLRRVYDRDFCPREWHFHYGDTSEGPSPPSDFFRNRQTMTIWTPSCGWERDIDLAEECPEEEKNVVRRMMSWG